MTFYQYDPGWYQDVKPLLDARAKAPTIAVHDVDSRRASVEAFVRAVPEPPHDPDVQTSQFETTSKDGTKIQLTLFYKYAHHKSPTPKPAALYIYWGGMIAGSVALASAGIAAYCSQADIPMLAVDYRRSPEVHGEKNIEDAFAGLTWLRDTARELNVDPERIAVFGESAGGGIAAGLALYARDQGFKPPIKKQVLVYPMLEDRNTVADEELEPFVIWSNADNVTGWTALLGEGNVGSDKVSIYNVPPRAKDLSALPPAYIDVGTLDIFCKENIEYASRLLSSKVPVELHVYPSIPHAFELMAPQSSWSKIAYANRAAALKSF